MKFIPLIACSLAGSLCAYAGEPLSRNDPPPSLADLKSQFGVPNSLEPTNSPELTNSLEPTEKKIIISSKAKVSAAAKPFVPAGFEDLLEPQTTQIDIYYGGRYLTSTLATFTPSDFSLMTPADVVERVPDLIDPNQALTLMSQTLPTNSELVCLKDNQTGCGRLEPEAIEVIFDENRFRADLFVAPELLSVRDAVKSKYLPGSTGGLSVLHQFGATTSGEEGQDKTYTISNTSTIAYKETRLVSITNITESEDFTFDTLALQREFQGRQFQAGYFRSSPANLVFLRQSDFAGLSVGSSLDTRKDLDQSTGNDLQVFLDSRSRVDIFKDDRLISSAVYETGNQIIDTSALPGGAYDIVLRIRDNAGQIREETRFYIKTNRLPPRDQALYFFDIGELVTKSPGAVLPESTGTSMVRAGLAKRLTDNFGGDIGVLHTDVDTVLESGFFWLGRQSEWRLNGAVARNNSYGLNLNNRIRFGNITLSTNLRKTWIPASRTSSLGTETTQGSLNINLPVFSGNLSLTGRYNSRLNDTLRSTDRNVGIRYDFASTDLGSFLFDANLQFSQDNGDKLLLLGLRLRRNQGRWQSTLNNQLFQDKTTESDTESGVITNLSTSWQDGDKYLSDVRFALRARDEQSDQSVEAEFEVASDMGRANLQSIYSTTLDRYSYNASFYTNLIANSDSLSFGGKSFARSALVMDIKGDVEDAYFDVEINKVPRSNAKIGTKTIISLSPYETYEVALRPKGKTLLDFNNRTQTATLYPGNVVTMNWEASKILIAFGEIIDTEGNPVANALIEGVVGLATTDEFGLFQAEIESNITSLTVRTRTSECKVTLPTYNKTEMLALLGELTCVK